MTGWEQGGWMRELLGNFDAARGMFLLPPDPTAAKLRVSLDGLDRPNGIVVDSTGDGGDSAHRTGILAFCGSNADQALLSRFEDGRGTMVRHPTQEPWNNPNNSSRDQLLAFMAGCWRCGQTQIASRLLDAHAARGWFCQNWENDAPGTAKSPALGDPIFPHEQMFLRVCAGQRDAHWDLIGQAMLQVTIEAVKTQPEDTEINQLVLESIVCCRLDHFVAHVPDYRKRLERYWAERRQQPQISAALCDVIEQELVRYDGFIGLSFPPFPVHQLRAALDGMMLLLDAATHINFWRDWSNLKKIPETPLQLFQAALRDQDRLARYYLALAPKFVKAAQRFVENSGFIGFPRDIAVLFGHDESGGVAAALRAVEQKVDEILTFLRRDLEGVIQKAVFESVMKVNATLATKEMLLGLMPAIKVLQAKPTSENAATVRNHAIDVLTVMNANIESGGVLAPSALKTMMVVLAAGAELLKQDAAQHAPYVMAWCADARKALQKTILNPGEKSSLLALMAATPTREAIDADAVRLPSHVSEWKLLHGLVFQNTGSGLLVQGGWARLHGFDGRTWNLTAEVKTKTYDFVQTPEARNFTENQVRELLGLQEFTVVDWFPPRDISKVHPAESAQSLLETANRISQRSRLGPTRDVLEAQFTFAKQLEADFVALERAASTAAIAP